MTDLEILYQLKPLIIAQAIGIALDINNANKPINYNTILKYKYRLNRAIDLLIKSEEEKIK